MFDQNCQRADAEPTTHSRRDMAEETPLSGAMLLDNDLEAVVGGLLHIGEEIPQ